MLPASLASATVSLYVACSKLCACMRASLVHVRKNTGVEITHACPCAQVSNAEAWYLDCGHGSWVACLNPLTLPVTLPVQLFLSLFSHSSLLLCVFVSECVLQSFR
eukprot:Tamp_20686.p6 GENE.Tamp_20686~~Tamp_20686.p6  ORF type:complete len:106 (+),score=8.20 Tamp_20686:86-403(+)